LNLLTSILNETLDQLNILKQEINHLKSDAVDIEKDKLIKTGIYLVNKFCSKNHLKDILD
jgi:hypothetical protein